MTSYPFESLKCLPIGSLVLQGVLLDGSGMNREVHVPFCERLLGRFRRPTHLTAIPELLQLLELKGCLVSIDAMGTQVKIADTILKKSGDYLLAVKDNQPSLNTEVKEQFQAYWDKNETDVSGHGFTE